MDTIGTIASWAREAWNAAYRLAFDPGYRGVLLALLVLAFVYSIARSLRRLNRRLSSAVAELEQVRSTLARIERIVEPSRTKPSPVDRQNRDIRDLPLREGHERR